MSHVDAARVEDADLVGVTELADLFGAYRRHYDQPDDGPAARAWLDAGLASGALSAFLARVGDEAAGLAIAVSTPASLRLSHFWQLRDLYVAEAHRGRGVGRALVAAVRDAARDDGALRLSLTTEIDNEAARRLYASMGFAPVEGYVSLSLDLPDHDTRAS